MVAAAAAVCVVVRKLAGTETIEIPAPAAAAPVACEAAAGGAAAMQGMVNMTVWVTVTGSAVIVVVPGAPEAKTVVVKKEKALGWILSACFHDTLSGQIKFNPAQ